MGLSMIVTFALLFFAFVPVDYNLNYIPSRGNRFDRTHLMHTLIPMSVIVLAIFLKCIVISKYKNCLEEVKKVCIKKSNKDLTVSFTLIYNPYQLRSSIYIQVVIGIGGTGSNLSNLEVGSSEFPIVVYNNRKPRVSQRLEELEGIRCLITERDYHLKKREILNDI